MASGPRRLDGAARRSRSRVAALLAWPTLALTGLVAVPFGLLVRISLASPDPSGMWTGAVTLDAYRDLLDGAFVRNLLYSLGLALLVAVASVAVGFSLTYFITRMRRQLQVVWLVFLLTTLSLSDVLIAFSWQVMLSKRAGLSNLFALMGMMDRPRSLAPNGAAVISNLIYLALPFTVLVLYPALSRLDSSLIEAARTLGATPYVAFRSVVVPASKRPLIVALVMSSVLTLGAYVAPIVLGKPEGWTVAVLIGNTALAGRNIPRAAAMALCLLGGVAALWISAAGLWACAIWLRGRLQA
ncbi:MAG: ABC transporter permease subunit [Pseudomonadota bacterium]|nr:ABC transporter permease subunit [Pseudomonadota bacterium]